MSDPRTLLQMAGATPEAAPLSETALVVIDAQMEYVDGSVPLAGMAEALGKLARLLERARAANAAVVHVVHRGKAGGLFDPEGHGGQVVREALPREGETVVEKALPNAFANTNLGDVLRELARPSLTIAGFMTHMCVSSTARAALDHGFRTIVAADATATRDLPGPLGGVVSAQELQRAALAAIADRFGAVVPVDRIPD